MMDERVLENVEIGDFKTEINSNAADLVGKKVIVYEVEIKMYPDSEQPYKSEVYVASIEDFWEAAYRQGLPKVVATGLAVGSRGAWISVVIYNRNPRIPQAETPF